jgi:hypothetical protein
VGLELKIPVFERAKTIHASDRAVTVIGLPENECGLLNNAFSINIGVPVATGGRMGHIGQDLEENCRGLFEVLPDIFPYSDSEPISQEGNLEQSDIAVTF